MAIAYWMIIYGMSMVPNLSNNYTVNIIWMTLVIPNMLRLIVGSIPRLAVDRVFFLASTVFAFVLTYLLNMAFSDTKEAVECLARGDIHSGCPNYILFGYRYIYL
jgi:hypothetical protein